MKRTSSIPSHATPDLAETLTMRMAVSADAPALRRLAQLDSAPAAERAPMPMLVAEVGGELRAALPLDGGPAIANPFRRTALKPSRTAQDLKFSPSKKRLSEVC